MTNPVDIITGLRDSINTFRSEIQCKVNTIIINSITTTFTLGLLIRLTYYKFD